jgi:ABC-type sugar transport system permease subunit
MKKVLIFPSLILIIALAFYFSFLDYESCSSEKISFVINKPYLTIIKDFAKKESLEKTIEDNDGKLVYKEWKNSLYTSANFLSAASIY